WVSWSWSSTWGAPAAGVGDSSLAIGESVTSSWAFLVRRLMNTYPTPGAWRTRSDLPGGARAGHVQGAGVTLPGLRTHCPGTRPRRDVGEDEPLRAGAGGQLPGTQPGQVDPPHRFPALLEGCLGQQHIGLPRG